MFLLHGFSILPLTIAYGGLKQKAYANWIAKSALLVSKKFFGDGQKVKDKDEHM
jgi:hypothetical protein